MPAVFASPADLVGAEGRILGPSSWVTIDQGRIQAFADATGDQQWIHTDPARAADGPFGATIAHGFLTLSLTAAFAEELLRVYGTAQVINYGADKLRFLQSVLVGSSGARGRRDHVGRIRRERRAARLPAHRRDRGRGAAGARRRHGDALRARVRLT